LHSIVRFKKCTHIQIEIQIGIGIGIGIGIENALAWLAIQEDKWPAKPWMMKRVK
jgi:hypothetical protein